MWVIVMHKASLRVKAFSGVYISSGVFAAAEVKSVQGFKGLLLCLEITNSHFIADLSDL